MFLGANKSTAVTDVEVMPGMVHFHVSTAAALSVVATSSVPHSIGCYPSG
jgi:hypothetical protein